MVAFAHMPKAGRALTTLVWVLAVTCIPRERDSPKSDSHPVARLPNASPTERPSKRERPAAAPRAATHTEATTAASTDSALPEPAPTERARRPDQDPLLETTFQDNFQRESLGDDWFSTSTAWKVRAGQLCGEGARNRPVWLTRRLPTNARIEFDATSHSPEGDLKVEVWGDGQSGATGTSYSNATSYLVILGGWKNQLHVLARLDEHAPNRKSLAVDPTGATLAARPVKMNRAHHFKIERADARTVRWLVDDIEILELADPEPLDGPSHDHFAFNDWEAPVCFDNLVITPLGSPTAGGRN